MTDLFTESDCDKSWEVQFTHGVTRSPAISLAKANRLFREFLAKGTVETGSMGYHFTGLSKVLQPFGEVPGAEDTHTAILVCVKPIEPEDSAESLLRELINRADMKASLANNPKFKLNNWIERARKLLDKDK